MTVRVIVINDDSNKSIQVHRMTYHCWDMGKLGVENIYDKPYIINPKCQLEFYIWPEHMILIEEKEQDDNSDI